MKKMNMGQRFLVGAVAFLLVALMGLGVSFFLDSQQAQADGGTVTNYYTRSVLAGTTAYTTTGGQTTGIDVSGYGEVLIHLDTDASATTSTLTVYPQYSNYIAGACSAATSWFTGTDYQRFLTQPEIATTVAVSSSGGTTTTTSYTYGSASASSYSFVPSVSTDGDEVAGRAFKIYGRCMRLNLSVDYGTVTPTILIMTRDYQE